MGHIAMTHPPVSRYLRGYAFDPSIALQVDSVDISHIVYKVPWEDSTTGKLKPGPIGDYLEVVDYDPTVKQLYKPVDLDDPYILASQGLDPSESNPQFHQQMVYAVAMLTITNFERALGRKIHWAPRQLSTAKYEEYVPRLRLYPHALREANAFYSPLKKAILFGYFAATPADSGSQMPGSLVFTCLSHDIIAHEVTHAILDGLHRNYNRPTNPDVLAFHEAFADIVALFQRFTFPDVLKHQIARTRGDLEKQNLLGELAQQFGTSIGQYGSLRDAIGKIDPNTGQWKLASPDPNAYTETLEPHARGSILVSAVFNAFLTVYKTRVADLLRIATGGSGILPEGALHPDLINRLANEASKTAGQILSMCIRALDYCPPFDITFGDYLRAIITADVDLVSEDDLHYRLAFIDAFRRRGIYPDNIKTLSEGSLRYPVIHDTLSSQMHEVVEVFASLLRKYRERILYCQEREELFNETREFINGTPTVLGFHAELLDQINNEGDYETVAEELQQLTGLIVQYWEDYGIRTSRVRNNELNPSIQVLDLHLVSRTGPDGNQLHQVVFCLVQRMGVIKTEDGFGNYTPPANNLQEQPPTPASGFEMQGGCTLIFDLETMKLRYCISKPLLDPVRKRSDGGPEINVKRASSQYKFQFEALPESESEFAQSFGMSLDGHFSEPFALLHPKERTHGHK